MTQEKLEDKVEKISQKEDIRDKNETIMVPVQDTQHQNNEEKEKILHRFLLKILNITAILTRLWYF